MARFIVHLVEKRNGTIEVDAACSQDAITEAKRIVQLHRLPEFNLKMEEVTKTTVAYTEPL